ncbi:MAG TPA: hypothetical protein VNS32_28015 [Flavisolibacter sp.]|nr:hypothetical protein [Flavisolibacter sp.]
MSEGKHIISVTPEIIELYCLGMLSEDERMDVQQQAENNEAIKKEIEHYQQSMKPYEKPGQSFGHISHFKARTMELLENLKLEEAADIHDLPLINKYTETAAWLKMVKPVLPAQLDRNMFIKELRNNGTVSQTVIWTAVNYPDEVHDDVHECFIILEGRCVCFIEDEMFELGPGGYLEIPLFKHHDVKVLEPVLAVVQRLKVA